MSRKQRRCFSRSPGELWLTVFNRRDDDKIIFMIIIEVSQRGDVLLTLDYNQIRDQICLEIAEPPEDARQVSDGIES